jgi:medium-chain acyl-[acyl-carrier-protein] hydrolase
MTTYARPPAPFAAPPADRWLGLPPAGAGGPLRLFCFPHAGGGSTSFQPWHRPLTGLAEVRPVVLPGRERRLREMPYVAMEQLVEPLFEALEPLLDEPYALFGHSMGAVVAYEFARRCTAAGRPPAHLFASGRRAPHLPARRESYTGLADDDFMAAVAAMNGTPADVLEQPELFRLFLPCLRADFELNDGYRPLPGPRLTCPLTALAGRDDPEVDANEAGAWSQVTAGPASVRLFPGDHFYLSGLPGPLLDELRGTLAQLPVSYSSVNSR